MQTSYSPQLKSYVACDDAKKVRHIRHSQEYRLSEENAPRFAASAYLHDVADVLDIPVEQLRGLHTKAQNLWPREQGAEYQFEEEKRLFDASTLCYVQTYLNVPVWRRGLSVSVKQAPTRVLSVTDNSEAKLDAKLPDEEVVERYRDLFRGARGSRNEPDPVPGEAEDGAAREAASFAGKLLGGSTRAATGGESALLSGKFFVYRYEPELRYGGSPAPPEPREGVRSLEDAPAPFVKLPKVAKEIRPGRGYLVAELLVRVEEPGYGELVWLLLVELQTQSVLYVECMTHGVDGMVFKRDPMVQDGDLTVTSDDGDAILQSHDTDVTLQALDAPVGGTQSLSGTYVQIQEVHPPAVAPPTRPSGADFDFPPRTNDFAAVSAYYHETELFRTIEDLGFVIADYFDGTTFPIPVDHRGLGDVINAHWVPNGVGGTAHLCFALCDETNIAQPLGRAVDPWVHWHEMGGHGTLGDHVGGGNFGFAHSAGDGLGAIQMDPESALRGLPERFRYAPFRPIVTVERRFDRPVPEWAWGSPVVLDIDDNLVSGDDGNSGTRYGAEQILATCHFRAYRSIGGDHASLGRRLFASRVMTYLILRAIGELSAGTNPSNWDPGTMTFVPGRGAELWCERLQATDAQSWVSEGLSGGAYNKVIRWSFEQQGNYASNPPAVDVYIDDGRGGEYPFQAVHWHNTSMWNRQAADGIVGHQNALGGATNHMYVKVKNRGTSAAGTVRVKAYHCLPGAGLTWPTDFTEMTPAGGLTVPSIGAASSEEVTLGPFEWVPNENVYGHDCVLMVASCDGDASNVDNFTPAETVEEWRLVPNDNNVGQRNITIEPGGGGGEALIDALHGAVFVAGNSFNRPARMELRVALPRVLADKGWGIDLGDSAEPFRLKAGEKRHVRLGLVKGASFTADEVRGAVDRDIDVDLYADDVALGGMTYRIDPDLKERAGGTRPPAACDDAARHLLDCLDISGGDKVKGVCVKRVSLDIELGGGEGCC